MVTVTADGALEETLGKLDQTTEIRDTDGKVIGYFAPKSQADPVLYAEAAAHFDPEEIKRRKASGKKGRTTHEVLDRLESLEVS